MTTKIEWTRGDDGTPGVTWNPVTGCTKVSQGCKNCYAERLAPKVFAGQRVPDRADRDYQNFNERKGDVIGSRPRRFTDVLCHPERLDAPLHWRQPRRVFVNSMSDLFHEDVPFDFIECVFGVMAMCPQHTFQILTKRAERMRKFMSHGLRAGFSAWAPWQDYKLPKPRDEHWGVWPLPNVWLGVSCEDQATADERIPLLLEVPAAVRFVSAEPLLGPVDFMNVDTGSGWRDCLNGYFRYPISVAGHYANEPLKPALDWVIVGSESGPGARAMNIEWPRSIVYQCAAAGVACFVKQIANALDRKGGNPEHWPAGHWPREFPC